ncbi:MAG TPA: alpha/beta hydrolase [Candidatus Binataceae bacterium]
MADFISEGVRIHFEEQGSGDPVVLVHGFGSNAKNNWEVTGWLSFLSPHFRVIAMDCRGHGQSDKPHDPDAYGAEVMAGDVIRLLDHLNIRRTLLMGYSMGARLSAGVLLRYPERLRAVVLGGIGSGGGMSNSSARQRIVDALLTDDESTIKEQTPREFRQFAKANSNDLKALGACMAGQRPSTTTDVFASNKVAVLIVVGTADTLVGTARPLQQMIPGSRLVELEGRDHLNAPGDRKYKEAVLEFFKIAPA